MRTALGFSPLVLLATLVVANPGIAQDVPDPDPNRPLTLSLDEALQIALARSHAIRSAELDVETAEGQVREARSGLYPHLELSSSYNRNVVEANPFAGSSAGDIFGGLGATGWLQFNESARTDSDPDTNPISLVEYNNRIQGGYDAIGYVPPEGDNPFSIPNQFSNTVAFSQTLYSGTAFAAVRGARDFVGVNEAALDNVQLQTVDQVTQSFYGTMLASRQVEVLEASADRARETLNETAQQVSQGVRPSLDRMNAEVDLANAETQLVDARAGAETALDQLLLALGLSPDQPVTLRGELELPAGVFETVGLAASVQRAVEQRPDIRQAELLIRLNETQRQLTRAAGQPTLNLFANLGYSGSVPDNRGFVFNPNPDEPFTFEEGSNGFFSDSYWQPSVAVGLSLTWNIFDGFQTRYRAQQDQVAIEKSRVQLEQATYGVEADVARAIRDLDSARLRLETQERTVETAETAYRFAQQRLEEGVATLVDVRLASSNLDQARLNYLQAVHDALVARSAFETATGQAVSTMNDE